MLKRLFRLALILIILLWISKYTTVLDNTKIKPYLTRVETIITNNTESIRSWFGSNKQEEVIDEQEISWSIDYGITWAANFGNEDMINSDETSDEVITELTWKNEDVVVVEQNSNDWNNTWVKKIANLQIKNCVSPRWKFVPKNGYIIAYEARSSSECKREKRTCNNGKLEWSFMYDTCFYSSTISKQQTTSSLSRQELQAMKEEYGLIEEVNDTANASQNNNELINGTIAGPWILVNSSQTKEPTTINTIGTDHNTDANLLKNSVNDPDKHYLGNGEKSIAILDNQQTELNNNKLKTRSLKKQVQWYKWESFISDYKKLTAKNSFYGKFCTTPWGSIISNGQFIVARKSTIVDQGVCEMETRFCIDGKLQWSFGASECKWAYPEIINNAPGLDVTNNAIAVGYTETRNVMKNNMIDLDYMPTSPWVNQRVSSYEVFHQLDDIDSNRSPTFQFVPIESNGVYIDSQIVLDPGYVIYHQPDER